MLPELDEKLTAEGGAEALHQGDRQGAAEGDVQDGHLDLPVLLRRADLRRRGPASRASCKKYFTGTHTQVEGVGLRQIARETAERHRPGLRRRAGAGERARRRRRVRLPHPRRGAHVARRAWSPTCSTPCAATCPTSTARYAQQINDQSEQLMTLRGLFRIKVGRGDGPQAGAARGGRAGRRHRQALLDRRHELRLDLPRGAHHARHRHEPHRRQVEHRRGRRGGGPLQAAAQRRFHALGHQAGGLGPLRRDGGVPRQRRHDADQDGAGRQARRGRPAARPQGRRDHRQGAPLDAGRRPDLAAAAPRHLLDRGPGAAHLRPEERQPAGRRVGEARLRGRRRHGRGRRRQGARRPRDDRRLRGRHRRLAAHLDQARRLAVGDRPRRDAPDAGRSTACAAASPCRSTAACARAATW